MSFHEFFICHSKRLEMRGSERSEPKPKVEEDTESQGLEEANPPGIGPEPLYDDDARSDGCDGFKRDEVEESPEELVEEDRIIHDGGSWGVNDPEVVPGIKATPETGETSG
jgi:hypothetical protein